MRQTPLPVTVFADFTCPYCYVAEAALRLRDAADLDLHHRAFELYPAPASPPPPDAEPGWRERVAPLAGEAGVRFGAPAFRPRTRKAHEAARFARARGVEREMRAALYAAFWEEERDIGRIDVLTSLIEPLGVDPEELRIALDIDLHREEVERDGALARRLRVASVPTLFLGTGPGARVLVGVRDRAGLDSALAAAL